MTLSPEPSAGAGASPSAAKPLAAEKHPHTVYGKQAVEAIGAANSGAKGAADAIDAGADDDEKSQTLCQQMVKLFDRRRLRIDEVVKDAPLDDMLKDGTA